MKKLIALTIATLVIGCSATQQDVKPETAKLDKKTQTYNFSFLPRQAFFYQDDKEELFIMFQVKDLNTQPIPKEFQIKLADGTVRILNLFAAYPQIKKEGK